MLRRAGLTVWIPPLALPLVMTTRRDFARFSRLS
jgi:hypothetical protein